MKPFSDEINAKRWKAFRKKTREPVQESAAEKKKRDRRMQWWRDARFGMIVHFGPASLIERHDWVMNRERMPPEVMEQYAREWKVKESFAREWVRLAKQAGMRYIVLTTKHHDGFSLWDSEVNPFNAVQYGPGRDLVAEVIKEARKAGLGTGLYYSMMDWRHPDGERCALDEEARKRFVAFTHGCVRELMTRYGKIDILWYDVPFPLQAVDWESARLNRMVRSHQPDIIINDRSYRLEDFTTPEEKVNPAMPGRDWEACFTMNGSWSYMPTLPEEWLSPRAVVKVLQQVSTGGGNLLLNLGPLADGSVCAESEQRLKTIGKWIRKYEEAFRGATQPIQAEWTNHTAFSVRGKTVYFWIHRWLVDEQGELAIGGLRMKINRISFLHTDKPVRFEQTSNRLILKGLPKTCPDRLAHMVVLKGTFEGEFMHCLGPGYQELLLRETFGKALDFK